MLLRAALFLDHISTILAILRWERVQGFGIALEFYGSHPTHGPFLLRAIGRIVAFFVLPGYVLMLVTGLWMVNMAWPLTTRWIQGATALWALGIAGLVTFLAVLRRQIDSLRPRDLVPPRTAEFR